MPVRGAVDSGPVRQARDGGADRSRRTFDCRCAILPRGQDRRGSDEEVAVERRDGVACRLLGRGAASRKGHDHEDGGDEEAVELV